MIPNQSNFVSHFAGNLEALYWIWKEVTLLSVVQFARFLIAWPHFCKAPILGLVRTALSCSNNTG